jgi:hypothetical protein
VGVTCEFFHGQGALTAAHDAQARAAEIKADTWLAKPFHLDALFACVELMRCSRVSSSMPCSHEVGPDKRCAVGAVDRWVAWYCNLW